MSLGRLRLLLLRLRTNIRLRLPWSPWVLEPLLLLVRVRLRLPATRQLEWRGTDHLSPCARRKRIQRWCRCAVQAHMGPFDDVRCAPMGAACRRANVKRFWEPVAAASSIDRNLENPSLAVWRTAASLLLCFGDTTSGPLQFFIPDAVASLSCTGMASEPPISCLWHHKTGPDRLGAMPAITYPHRNRPPLDPLLIIILAGIG